MNDSSQRDSATTCFYDRQIPPFTETALENLYGALYSSLPQLALGEFDGVGTYANSAEGSLRAVFLYARQGRELRVVNEGMTLDAADIGRFAQHAFSRDPKLRRIRFHAIRSNGMPPNHPACRLPVTEDILIELPATEEAYVASLGKATRKTLKQNLSRASRLSHKIMGTGDVDAGVIDTIIGFNHARMAGKQRSSALDARASAQLMTLLQARGMVGVVSIDGRPCAGTLACRIGDDVYSLVNAHDPAVNHLGMGNISRHLMILASIRGGAKRFHLLGGHFASKRSCGAQRIPLIDLNIYRSRFAMMSDITGIAAMTLRSADYKLRVALEDGRMTGRSGWRTRIAALCGRLMRDSTHALRRLTSAQ